MLRDRLKRITYLCTSSLGRILGIIALLSVLVFCLAYQGVRAYGTPAGYNANDYQKLVAFLELPNGAGKNGDKISASYNPEDPTTWAGVIWNGGTEKRVLLINLTGKGLVGDLDVSGCKALWLLSCSSNQLTALNVSDCTALIYLNCSYNQVSSLDVRGFAALNFLDCQFNQMTSLDVSGCATLKYLYCVNNQLTVLNVSDCTFLNALYCTNNQLTSLDVSSCTALLDLFCAFNDLIALDVSGCTALETFYCNDNRLASLDVSGCTALNYLDCDSNQLTSLNVIGCARLRTLFCSSNQLTFATLPLLDGIFYYYDPQNEVQVGSEGKVVIGNEIDLSAEAVVNGVGTVFTWYRNDGLEIVPATSVNGIFTFDQGYGGQTIYCQMTNATFPELTLETSRIQLTDQYGE